MLHGIFFSSSHLHTVDTSFYVKTPSLLTRLVETRGLLDEAFKTLSNAAARKIDVSPAGDWLYVIIYCNLV